MGVALFNLILGPSPTRRRMPIANSSPLVLQLGWIVIALIARHPSPCRRGAGVRLITGRAISTQHTIPQWGLPRVIA